MFRWNRKLRLAVLLLILYSVFIGGMWVAFGETKTDQLEDVLLEYELLGNGKCGFAGVFWGYYVGFSCYFYEWYS